MQVKRKDVHELAARLTHIETMKETFYGICGRAESAQWPFSKQGAVERLQKKTSRMKQMFLELMRES